MSDIRPVTADFAVAPQLEPQDMADAARRGFVLVINNRPDGEAPDQPGSETVAAAAKAAGLDYRHIPFAGRPGEAAVDAMRTALEGAGGPVLAFCRSGTRSITAWALSGAGGMATADVLAKARDAGYDLSGVVG